MGFNTNKCFSGDFSKKKTPFFCLDSLKLIRFWIDFYYKNYLSFHYNSSCPKKDFMIIIQSSNKTKYRLHKYLDYYYVNKSHIHYFIVYSEKVEPDPKYPYLLAKSCKDNTISLIGKNAYAYEYFLNNKNMGDFLYRAIDDTILNITNLEK